MWWSPSMYAKEIGPPSFTCLRVSVERAVNALDGEALTVSALG